MPSPDKPVAEVPLEKTVVFKNADGEYSYAHLNADGEAWIHNAAAPWKAKDDALTAARLAYPAWPVEEADEDPWLPKVAEDDD